VGRPNRDHIYLGQLRDYFAQHRLLPSHAEISRILGLKAKNASYMLCRRLADAGFIEAAQGGRLAPGRRFFERPYMAQQVPAGTGEPGMFDGGMDAHEIDRFLVDEPSRSVLVTVRGDSMSGAGVLDGDVAVVERSEHAGVGDFVVAYVDGNYTLKELAFEGDQPILVPHNPSFRSIRPKAEFNILGVVRGIVRRYRPQMGTMPTRKIGEKR